MKPTKNLLTLIVLFGILSIISLLLMCSFTPESIEKALGRNAGLWLLLFSGFSFVCLSVVGIVFVLQAYRSENRTKQDKITAAIWAGSMVGCLLLAIVTFSDKRPEPPIGGTQFQDLDFNAPTDRSTSWRDYYYRNIENPEPEEYVSARWVMEPVGPVRIEPVEWPDEFNPTMADVRDSIWWNYFKPGEKRDFRPLEQNWLVKHGFFLEETSPAGYLSYDDMIDAYDDLYVQEFGENYSTVPVFISTDFLLHVYHVVFDRMIQDVEERKFYFRLVDLTKRMTAASLKELDQVTGTELEDPAQRILAYFSVAHKLIDTSFVEDPRVGELVREELARIQSASTQEMTEILEQSQDYTQFRPRGHYTKSLRLSRYFQTMMWFGRSAFPVKNEKSTLMALIITKMWSEDNIRNLWKSLVEPMNVVIGMPDDMSPEIYAKIAGDVYDDDLSERTLLDADRMKRFREEVGRRTGSQIEDRSNRGPSIEVDKTFRFLGQRFIPDSYMFTKLTSPRIGSDVLPRNMPKPADVMAILGSTAGEKLVAGDFRIPGYKDALFSLKREFNSFPDKTWTQTVYWSWLHSLRAIVNSKDHHYPFFMRGEQWAWKSLLTALASWSELRHDTILYSKQSGAEMGEGDEEIPPKPAQPKSYVEPDLEFFNRFVLLVEQTAETLSNNQLLSDEYLQKLSLFLDRVLDLQEIVRKELLNIDINHDEYEMLLNFSGSIGSIVIPEGSGDVIEDKHKQMALVADVHTDFFSKRVLEVAIGLPQRIYVLVKDKQGGSRVCVGYVFSYYEFTQPMDRRMTDDEWKEMIYTRNPTIREKEPEWAKQLRLSR